MQLGPVRISITNDVPGPGIWLSKNGGPDQNITVPAIVGAILMLSVLCCCARVVF